MTTTVTIETHGFPVVVTTTDDYGRNPGTDQFRQHGYVTSDRFIAANEKAQFTLSDTRSLFFRELPIGSTGMDGPPLNSADVGEPSMPEPAED